jgi:SAM-dependent methyltransferase
MTGSLLRRTWQGLVPEEWRRSLSVKRQERAKRARVDLGDLRRTSPIEEHLGRSRGGPVDRYYIEQFLRRHAADITGHVLEVADSGYTTMFGSGVTRADVLDIDPANSRATIVADVTTMHGVDSETFDCIVLTQVLQLVYDVPAAMRALERVLAPGGVLLATLPGLTRSALTKPEYWRFTARSARQLAEDAFGSDVEIQTHGNVLSATAFLYGLGQDDIDRDTLDVQDPSYEVTVSIRAVKSRRPR